MLFLILKKKLKQFKPKWLKSSFIKGKLNNFIFEIWYKFYKGRNKDNGNILINATEAMGDTIVKSGAMEIIRKKYGNDKVYIFANDKWEDILKNMNFNVIPKTKGYRRGFKDRIKTIKKIDEIGFNTIIDLNFVSDSSFISKLSYKKLIKLEEYIKREEEYVLKPIHRMTNDKIEKNTSFEEIKPDFKSYYDLDENGVVVGVGASHESKVFPPEKMIEVLKEVQKKYPNEKIYLLGANNKQRNYAEKIMKGLGNKSIINLVNEISLIESIEKIAKSKLYIGFDSGLFHTAYSFRKDIIVFFGIKSGFEHVEKNIQIIMGDGNSPVKDGFYGNDILNSIKMNQVEKALAKLGNIKR